MNQVATRLGQRIRGIAETTRADVSQTVADGLSAGRRWTRSPATCAT
jgi:hypothetical protein